jgi:tol-pal system protein YbgF
MRYLTQILVTASMLIYVGCATQSDVVYLNEHIISLDSRINRLEEQNRQLREEAKEAVQMMEEMGEPALTGQARINARLDAVQDDIDKLRGNLEEISHEIAPSKGQDALTRIEKRLARLETFLGLEAEKVTQMPETGLEMKEASPEITEKVPAQESELLYKEAYRLYEDGSFEKAREAFKEYLRLFPDTDKSDNAQFWIGECYYSEKRYEEAILEYEKVKKGYPDSNKKPSALLKQGLAFFELGDETASRGLLEMVVKNYPESNEAKIAKRKLAKIR